MTLAEGIRAKLDESMSIFEHVVDNLKETDLEVQINEGDNGWSVIEILRHVQNSERGMTTNLQSIVDGGEGVPREFDLMTYNTDSNAEMADVTLDKIKENMRNYRENTLALLQSIVDDDWHKKGRHPTQDVYTVEQIFEIIRLHPIQHLKGIRAKFGI